MGLQSALSTALTGLTAAETTIDVVGNNVANANTIGFKESNVNFATQFLQTQSIGSGPNPNTGGTNPRQIGLGVKVAEISPEFTQGTIEISSNPLDIAIQGDGFFMVQGAQGEQFFTRNGQFKTNSNNEIVTITGHRVLGHGIDSNFNIQTTQLTTLQIPLGSAAVAQATENVFLEGALNPQSSVGTTPAIIQSAILSDGSKEIPDNSTAGQSLARPADSTQSALDANPGDIAAGTYRYRVAFVDSFGNEGPPSNFSGQISVVAPDAQINLSNIPQPLAGSNFNQIRIYRNSDANPEFREVDTLALGTTTYADTTSDALLGAQLNQNSLANGNYSYYVTFYNSGNDTETRPSQRIGPITADATTSPNILLRDIPKPDADGEYNSIRIYRNLANSSNEYRLVTTLLPADIDFPGETINFIDKTPDSQIAANDLINLDGPDISFNLRLVDVVTRDGSNYTNLFEEGTLSFAGTKGGRQLEAKKLQITADTTVQDLINFMEDSMGVMKSAPEESFPDGTNYGGDIAGNRLRFTSNMGLENALSVSLSAFQLTKPNGLTSSIPFTFSPTNAALVNGEGASADFIVYDSLGIPLQVRVTTVMEHKDGNGASFRWIATSSDNEPETGTNTVIGTGVVNTDGQGTIVSVTNSTVGIERRQTPSASPLEFNLNFDQVTGLSTGQNSLSASLQDGFGAGTLSSFIVTDSGRIQGIFSNGSSRDLGQIRMARFANNSGLQQVGDNMFVTGVNSGLPIQGNPGSNGIGNITAGAVELSNTDIGQNLIELILASTQYRGGSRVITAVQQLLDELMALRR